MSKFEAQKEEPRPEKVGVGSINHERNIMAELASTISETEIECESREHGWKPRKEKTYERPRRQCPLQTNNTKRDEKKDFYSNSGSQQKRKRDINRRRRK